MDNLHQTRRESSSELGPIMRAKSVDELISSLLDSEDGSEESTEALDELIRRAALYTEIQTIQDKVYGTKAPQYRQVMLAPDSQRAQ